MALQVKSEMINLPGKHAVPLQYNRYDGPSQDSEGIARLAHYSRQQQGHGFVRQCNIVMLMLTTGRSALSLCSATRRAGSKHEWRVHDICSLAVLMLPAGSVYLCLFGRCSITLRTCIQHQIPEGQMRHIDLWSQASSRQKAFDIRHQAGRHLQAFDGPVSSLQESVLLSMLNYACRAIYVCVPAKRRKPLRQSRCTPSAAVQL